MRAGDLAHSLVVPSFWNRDFIFTNGVSSGSFIYSFISEVDGWHLVDFSISTLESECSPPEFYLLTFVGLDSDFDAY